MAINVYLTDAFGKRVAELRGFTEFKCVSAVNDVGYWSIKYPAQQFPRALFFRSGTFLIDRRIEVWRAPLGRETRLVFAGFVRGYEENADSYAYTEDYTDEMTVCYAAGSGTEGARVFTSSQNDARILASPLNRAEGLWEDTSEGDANVLQDGANQTLYQNRPIKDFAPRNIEINYLYPHDWGLGDTLTISTGDPQVITIFGPDLNHLLTRRIVAYLTGSPEARKAAEADDMMKEYVYENFGAGAAAARQLPAALGFEIAGDQTAGPALEYSSKFGKVLSVLQGVAERAAEDGTRVYFGMVPVIRNGIVVPRFETRIGRWGRDRTKLSLSSGGTRTAQLTVGSVQLTANSSGGEEVVPRFEEINA